MSVHCELLVLILALTLNGHVHTGEIFEGEEAGEHSRPYMVLLERHMKEGKPKYCGGFLLNEDFVMTAAHCHAKFYKVSLGLHSFYKNKEVQHTSVEKTFPHKDYDEKGYKNDIMLLKLSSKANLNDNVRPIALAGQDDDVPKTCIVSGWGQTDRNDTHMSPKLMEVNVTLNDSEHCKKDKSYCSEGKAGPGTGDSGGPLVCEDGKAHGVVSVKHRTLDIYSYTKISDYRSWINSTMKNALIRVAVD